MTMTNAWMIVHPSIVKSSLSSRPTKQQRTTPATFLSSSTIDNDSSLLEDTDYVVYQNTFYRLVPDSDVPNPTAVTFQERLRFVSDPTKPRALNPNGPRTYIFHPGGGNDDDNSAPIRPEVFRIHIGAGDHRGQDVMDSQIATALFVASNPQFVQGDVMQVASEDGVAGVLGCIGAQFGITEWDDTKLQNDDFDFDLKREKLFPPALRRLTLSEEGPDGVKKVYGSIQPFISYTGSNNRIGYDDIPWKARIPRRRYESYYRTIIGSDVDTVYLVAKELARTVANYLLPSDVEVLRSIAATSTPSQASSFGSLGINTNNDTDDDGREYDPAEQIDEKILPTFIHVCPAMRETDQYLSQFLEQGYRMRVDVQSFTVEKIVMKRIIVQDNENAEQTAEEEMNEYIMNTSQTNADANKNEQKQEQQRIKLDYRVITAFHHPDYTGHGCGEYFFPLETGEYEGGSALEKDWGQQSRW